MDFFELIACLVQACSCTETMRQDDSTIVAGHLLAVAAGFLLFFPGGDSPRRGHSTTMDQLSQKSK